MTSEWKTFWWSLGAKFLSIFSHLFSELRRRYCRSVGRVTSSIEGWNFMKSHRCRELYTFYLREWEMMKVEPENFLRPLYKDSHQGHPTSTAINQNEFNLMKNFFTSTLVSFAELLSTPHHKTFFAAILFHLPNVTHSLTKNFLLRCWSSVNSCGASRYEDWETKNKVKRVEEMK